MQYSRQRLDPAEVNHELLWLLVSLGTLISLAAWRGAGLPMPHCVFHSLTGFPCPTCGATRAAWQFLHGHFAASFAFNPLAFLIYSAVICYDLYAFVTLSTGAPPFRLRDFSRTEKCAFRTCATALIAANWLYLVVVRPF